MSFVRILIQPLASMSFVRILCPFFGVQLALRSRGTDGAQADTDGPAALPRESHLGSDPFVTAHRCVLVAEERHRLALRHGAALVGSLQQHVV